MLKDNKDNEFYYGFTNNLERRLKEHNNIDKEWRLLYYEAYLSERDARQREKTLKHYGQSRSHLKRRLRESLNL